jgi:hypothetical protein
VLPGKQTRLSLASKLIGEIAITSYLNVHFGITPEKAYITLWIFDDNCPHAISPLIFCKNAIVICLLVGISGPEFLKSGKKSEILDSYPELSDSGDFENYDNFLKSQLHSDFFQHKNFSNFKKFSIMNDSNYING